LNKHFKFGAFFLFFFQLKSFFKSLFSRKLALNLAKLRFRDEIVLFERVRVILPFFCVFDVDFDSKRIFAAGCSAKISFLLFLELQKEVHFPFRGAQFFVEFGVKKLEEAVDFEELQVNFEE
jgi:hypothetical protein